jgi:hypothetical protein
MGSVPPPATVRDVAPPTLRNADSMSETLEALTELNKVVTERAKQLSTTEAAQWRKLLSPLVEKWVFEKDAYALRMLTEEIRSSC